MQLIGSMIRLLFMCNEYPLHFAEHHKAAIYLHNLTTILADKGTLAKPGRSTSRS
jgi:hypothetical protein